MRYSVFKMICFMLFLGYGITYTQDFSGQYFIDNQGTGVILTLEKNRQGDYQGQLSGNGIVYEITGRIQDSALTGNVGDEWDGILFQAQLNGNALTFIMVETDDFGNPDYSTTQSLIFQRQPNEKITEKEEATTSNAVIINNKILTKEQIAEIEKTYGIKPRPGNYWYDAKSGLYGVVGYQAYGFMMPDHNFGTLDRHASGGNTGVLINGREIPLAEYTVWSYMVGNWIQPGNYWLDHLGNAGYEGNPMPVINLFQAAQQRAYNGQGGSGDNFWSSRFSAGNYNSDNSQGYVSVPGYGPVGYGFD